MYILFMLSELFQSLKKRTVAAKVLQRDVKNGAI